HHGRPGVALASPPRDAGGAAHQGAGGDERGAGVILIFGVTRSAGAAARHSRLLTNPARGSQRQARSRSPTPARGDRSEHPPHGPAHRRSARLLAAWSDRPVDGTRRHEGAGPDGRRRNPAHRQRTAGIPGDPDRSMSARPRRSRPAAPGDGQTRRATARRPRLGRRRREPGSHILLHPPRRGALMQSHGVEILLVEDNANDAELTLRALKQRNLANQVFVCHDGAEALDFFSNGASPVPKVVLLDLKLPKVDGLEVLRRLKGDARTKAIPIVVLTSSREEPDIE